MNFCQYLNVAFCCLPGSAAAVSRNVLGSQSDIQLNGKKYKIMRVLGEGGFSYVYLCANSAGKLFALKKIRCPLGEESVRLALKEINAYNMFRHPFIIRCEDYTTLQERDCKSVFILLPYYDGGNLQDLININMIQGTHISEPLALALFRNICVALIQLHEYRPIDVAQDRRESFEVDLEAENDRAPFLSTSAESQAEDVQPYAHFDLKPANVLLRSDGSPVLMDFGSCKQARRWISSRSEALLVQDEAAEHSTLPYRAPELFDTQTNSQIDERVDIWSMGCTMYSVLFHHSPFETQQTEQGSIALAVVNCQYKFPSDSKYSQSLLDAIKSCLSLRATDRPSARTLSQQLTKIMRSRDEAAHPM